MALDTVADYLARCRTLLQDTIEPYRYSDDDLVQSLNEGILEARKQRPELFLSSFRTTLPSYDAGTPATDVDIEPMYRIAFIYYMCGAAQLSDQEDTSDQRAVVFFNKFSSQLGGLP